MTKEYILTSPATGRALHIDYAKELNEQQLAAVTSPDGAALVIAGAGSGKTRTLTYRVAWLVEHGVPPDRILLLTFTNKAAKEMLQRVQHVLPADISRLWGGTFHSVGARMLRRHAKLLGYGSDFTILDRDDSKGLLDDIIKESKVDTSKERFPKANVLIEVFSLSVNTERPLTRILAEQYPYFEHLAAAIARFHEVYQERKRKNNAMDFDDLLSIWLRLLQQHQDVREFYAQQFQHILVDEYQDTNKIQADIVDLLASAHRNVMVVGDDSQSIYSWRGANFQNIIGFPQRYSGCKVFKIESNYRSTPQILNAANAVILPNREQFPKELHSTRRPGARPRLVVCANAGQEAQFVAQRVAELFEEGIPPSDIAVLYRAHFHSMELQMELTRRNISFVINSGIRFFEQAHVKDVAAFLRLATNPTDELAFKRAAKMLPAVGPRTADKLWLKLSARTDFPKSLSANQVVDAVPAKAKAHWKQLGDTFEQITVDTMRDDPAEQIRVVLEAVYDDYLKSAYTDYDYRNRRDDLERLMQFAATFETMQEFLEQMALLSNVESEGTEIRAQDKESLWLSTVHQAKGLEWHTLFIIGLADEMFPSGRALESRGGEEEERRLFYVAITRAKDELYLSFPMARGGRGGDFGINRPSRFLKDIPDRLLDKWNVSRGHSANDWHD